MKKLIFPLAISLLLFGCEHSATSTGKRNDDSVIVNVITSAAVPAMYDSLVANYIRHTENASVKATRKQKKVQWMLDRTEHADNTTLLIYHLGHDESDGGNTNVRFATDEWIYIDSISKQVYEYDLPNDTLIKWNK